ncbi:uncharacterized protein LOC111301926 [Durio zibethinus]|uniref:Uncharacterized protein LOC111301926 n=1 Tax=Durio zibethinus TaxID=66656 RepID=A0A6P5ZMM2_DURZI|nr:uncharacterized protein LOC111301926 [Durio zibethinus]
MVALILYVDDMIITGNGEEEITSLQEHLATEFEMKNLGGLKYFLGIEIARSNQGIFLLQRKYILDLLAETRMLDCKPANTPMGRSYECCVLNFKAHEVFPRKKTYVQEYNYLNINGYTDANWAKSITDRKSTSRYFTFLGGNLVNWRSKKQKVVAFSTAAAEF